MILSLFAKKKGRKETETMFDVPEWVDSTTRGQDDGGRLGALHFVWKAGYDRDSRRMLKVTPPYSNATQKARTEATCGILEA